MIDGAKFLNQLLAISSCHELWSLTTDSKFSTIYHQGRHGRFLAGKEAIVEATSPASPTVGQDCQKCKETSSLDMIVMDTA